MNLPIEMKSLIHKHILTRIFIEALFIAAKKILITLNAHQLWIAARIVVYT